MIDPKRTDRFKVVVHYKPVKRYAQYFWPSAAPWPHGVVQTCVEGKIYDSYSITINFQSYPIFPGDLVFSDELGNSIDLKYMDGPDSIAEMVEDE